VRNGGARAARWRRRSVSLSGGVDGKHQGLRRADAVELSHYFARVGQCRSHIREPNRHRAYPWSAMFWKEIRQQTRN
jgi:hypothetical protein